MGKTRVCNWKWKRVSTAADSEAIAPVVANTYCPGCGDTDYYGYTKEYTRCTNEVCLYCRRLPWSCKCPS